MTKNDELNLDGMSQKPVREIKRFKVKEGSQVFRILPPFGTNHQRKASKQIQLHWGFKKSDGSLSPLSCSYQFEGSCPICTHARALEKEAQRCKSEGDVEGFKSNTESSMVYRSRRSFILNAANKEGEVGILEITKTTHDQLIDLMREYINKFGKNPTSLTDGVWFIFNRSGKGFNTVYKVSLNKNMVILDDGEMAEKLDRTPLPTNIMENYENLAYDIHTMYKPISSDLLAEILEGSPIDKVLKKDDGETKPSSVIPKKEVVDLIIDDKEDKPLKIEETEVKVVLPEDEEEDWMKELL